MIKINPLEQEKGQSLVEVLVVLAIFAVSAVSLTFLLWISSDASRAGGEKTKALLLAREGLEASRAIRDKNFADLTNGIHGLVISGNNWILSGSSDFQDQFERALTIEDIDSDTKKVSCEVDWQITAARQGEVKLTSYLTNWLKEVVVSFCEGLAEPCSSFHNRPHCERQQGCFWQERSCAGDCFCSEQSIFKCWRCPGCSLVWQGWWFVCEGSCDCYSMAPNRCSRCSGCSQTPDQCAGTASACGSFDNQDDCEDQQGCFWSGP